MKEPKVMHNCRRRNEEESESKERIRRRINVNHI